MVDIPSVLKEVLDSSSQLSGWALAMVGGSVVVIVSTSYRRPDALLWRLPYLLFVPGWICIAFSLYLGNKIVGKYLASLMVHQEQISNIAFQVNDIYSDQRVYFLLSLVFFGLWLLIHLISWVFVETVHAGDKK